MFDQLFDAIDELCGDTPAPVKPRIRVYALIGRTVQLVSKAVQKLTSLWDERHHNEEGHQCPHCEGTGRYRMWLDTSVNNKCYRCNGKGHLDTRDMAFLRRRLEGHGPVSGVRSAPAA